MDPEFVLTIVVKPGDAPSPGPLSSDGRIPAECAVVAKRRAIDEHGTVDAVPLGNFPVSDLDGDDRESIARQVRALVADHADELGDALAARTQRRPDLLELPLELDLDAVLADRTGTQFPVTGARPPADNTER